MINLEIKDVCIKVKLVTINDIHNFAFACGRCKCSVIAQHNEFSVNAKSILGLLSLDLSEPISVTFKGLKDTDNLNEFVQWIVA